MNIKSIILNATSTIGGNIKDSTAVSSSIESFQKTFDSIPLEYFEEANNPGLEELFVVLVNNERIEFLEKYAISENTSTKEIEKKIEAVDRDRDELTFMGLVNKLSKSAERLLKVHNLLIGQVIGAVVEAVTLKQETKDAVLRIIEISREGAVVPFNNIITSEEKKIQETPETTEGQDKLDSQRETLDILGMLNQTLIRAMQTKEKKIPVDRNLTIKRKKRIISRLIRSISIGQLPSISNRQISHPGDYFKLFKALERENGPWMDLALKKYVFGNTIAKYDEFNRSARSKESPEEEDQLVYLNGSRSWILSYIKSIKDGELDVRSETNYITNLETVVLEKSKTIKNYYLSRDFNLGNFGGIHLTPEINLPLYTKVKLAVTDEDRKAESPLRNLFKGLGGIASGLLGGMVDDGDDAFAQSARKRNMLVWNGISSILKGASTLIAGKEAGRKTQKATELKDGTKSVKEQMEGGSGGDGAPGQAFQTPNAIASEMDTMSLHGPGRKKKTRKAKLKKKVLTKRKKSKK